MMKNFKEEIGIESRKIENSYEILGYMYYDQVNKS